VPSIARCLQDESTLIRRHALTLMSQLLLQDYLKWRGLLLHRYLAVLVDKDPKYAHPHWPWRGSQLHDHGAAWDVAGWRSWAST
jgi:hypothetical protein